MEPGDAESGLTTFWRQLADCEGNLERLLEVITHRASTVLGEACVLAVLSESGQTLQPTAFDHPDAEVLEAMREALSDSPYRVGEGVAGLVAAERKAVMLSDLDPAMLTPVMSAPARRFAERYPIRSMMVVPLVAFGQVLGTLGVMRSCSDLPYTHADLVALEALAERAALAIADAARDPHRLGREDYRAIFHHSLDGVLFTRPDGRVLAANPAACQILRLTEAEICRLGRAGLLVNDERTAGAVAQRARTGSVQAEISMIRGDGERFLADLSSTTFTTEDGELRACVIFRDVSEQAAQRRQLENQTHELELLVQRDPLSGLLNRRGFVVDAERALRFADRELVPVQLLFCDLDDLKGINDRYGHKVGDEALQRLGASIAGAVRDVDVGAHLSGDEFVVLLYGATIDEARVVLDRIGAAFETSARTGPAATFSAGIAERPVGSPMALDDLLNAADRAMYTRKIVRRIDRGQR